MLAIFNSELVQPPKELKSPVLDFQNTPKLSRDILNDFVSSQPTNAFSISFRDKASLAYAPPLKPHSMSHTHRVFCGLNDIYCIFLGSLNNLCSLIKSYGLTKNTDEAMFIIHAYRTLRDRGPYPADQVLKDLDGCFAFVVFDSKAGTVFFAQDANEGKVLYWGISQDGSVVISDDLNIIKSSCAKSFAPFLTGCMFHSERGLMSFEQPSRKMKAMPRIDSEGMMCGANFKVDVQSSVPSMPRVGSEANWAGFGSQTQW